MNFAETFKKVPNSVTLCLILQVAYHINENTLYPNKKLLSIAIFPHNPSSLFVRNLFEWSLTTNSRIDKTLKHLKDFKEYFYFATNYKGFLKILKSFSKNWTLNGFEGGIATLLLIVILSAAFSFPENLPQIFNGLEVKKTSLEKWQTW